MEAVSPDDGPVTPPSGHTPSLHWGAPVVCVQGLGLIATEFYYTMQVGAPPWTPTLCGGVPPSCLVQEYPTHLFCGFPLLSSLTG